MIRDHDTDHVGQLSLNLTDKPASDFTARRCETCQTVTVAKILSRAALKGPKTLTAEETDDVPKRTHDHRNGNGH